ncbi:MAG: hypothetical protein Q9169_000072 [Polycauliona sp. 2 TL-2023]
MVATRSGKGADMLTLDKDSPVRVRYHAEGAANVVFIITSDRVSSRDDDYGIVGTTTRDGIPRIDVRLKGKLLRLRKDVPSVTPVVDSHRHYEDHIEPLFPAESLVEQLLCKITPGFVRKCNAVLRMEEEQHMSRPKKRHGVNLSQTETHGLLITDMRYDGSHASTEFKPKWLVQSPSAPPDSKRCRTCALRALRDVKNNAKVRSYGPEPSDFCPLTLVSGDKDLIYPSLEPILLKAIGAPLDILGFADLTLLYFQNLRLFKVLRDLQAEKDPKGILEVDPSNVDFMTAMALRDCTFFLKIPNQNEQDGARIEARLGDLDLKTPDGGKEDYWRETERQLINEGWYTATEKTPAPKGSMQRRQRASGSSGQRSQSQPVLQHLYSAAAESTSTDLYLAVPGFESVVGVFLSRYRWPYNLGDFHDDIHDANNNIIAVDFEWHTFRNPDICPRPAAMHWRAREE